MLSKLKIVVKSFTKRLPFKIASTNSPVSIFHSNDYLRHNARRLEHLASLRIPVAGMSVLEVGAGIGDHSQYYIDRGCFLTITEGRAENLEYLRARYPDKNVGFLDMENPFPVDGSPFDIVHCYGLLYHLGAPLQALEFLGQSTKKILILETCVSFGEREEINLVPEIKESPSQACSGTGCRPTRSWLYKQLKNLFEYVYLPKTQPNHEEFPLNWTVPSKLQDSLSRAIFISSRERLDNDMLVQSLIDIQTRHE